MTQVTDHYTSPCWTKTGTREKKQRNNTCFNFASAHTFSNLTQQIIVVFSRSINSVSPGNRTGQLHFIFFPARNIIQTLPPARRSCLSFVRQFIPTKSIHCSRTKEKMSDLKPVTRNIWAFARLFWFSAEFYGVPVFMRGIWSILMKTINNLSFIFFFLCSLPHSHANKKFQWNRGQFTAQKALNK